MNSVNLYLENFKRFLSSHFFTINFSKVAFYRFRLFNSVSTEDLLLSHRSLSLLRQRNNFVLDLMYRESCENLTSRGFKTNDWFSTDGSREQEVLSDWYKLHFHLYTFKIDQTSP